MPWLSHPGIPFVVILPADSEGPSIHSPDGEGPSIDFNFNSLFLKFEDKVVCPLLSNRVATDFSFH